MRNAFLAGLLFLAATPAIGADAYPARPVRIIIPFAPGGSTDLIGRVVSRQLAEQYGRPFLVENRTGAGGTIANDLVAKSAPDGHTLMVADTSTTIAPGLFKSLSFDVARDFTPITQLVGVPNVLVVHPGVKAGSLKEFIALAQASPGTLNYGSAGVGAINHLSGELFKLAAKVNIVHVPFKGGAGEITAAITSGQVQMLISTVANVLTYVNDGRMRALAVTSDGNKRAPALPNVPSMAEAGLPGLSIYAWFGLMGPAGLPRDVVGNLHGGVVKALQVQPVRDALIAQGCELVGSSPDEFSRHVRSELQRWAGVIKSSGVTPE